MTNLLSEGFVDSFRELYPEEKGAYSFWTFMGNARAKNVGWSVFGLFYLLFMFWPEYNCVLGYVSNFVVFDEHP